jgi:hypothetical protein
MMGGVDPIEYWRVDDAAMAIVITCRGHDRARTVRTAVTAFHALASKREGRFTIVADLREMTGYETESRVAWQNALFEHRKRIDGLVLVGARSALIRMGAAAVGAFAAIPVKFVKSWTEAGFDGCPPADV